MVDAGGGPWQTPADAISLGRRLERHGLLFYEDPVLAVDIDGLARVAQSVDLPIAIGEAYPDVFALRPLIERGIIESSSRTPAASAAVRRRPPPARRFGLPADFMTASVAQPVVRTPPLRLVGYRRHTTAALQVGHRVFPSPMTLTPCH